MQGYTEPNRTEQQRTLHTEPKSYRVVIRKATEDKRLGDDDGVRERGLDRDVSTAIH